MPDAHESAGMLKKPSRTLVKCCGLRRMEDIQAVNEAGADFAGFIMSPAFWRYVPPETVRELAAGLNPAITPVGVFVNENAPYVAEQINSGIVRMVQLHGSEDEEYIRTLKSLIKTLYYGKIPGNPALSGRIIKAFKVDCKEDLIRAASCGADYVLLDSGTGTGKAFDWALMDDIKRPYFFAGGLNTGNVEEAVNRFHPFAVDVSSGVETDRKKDREKVLEFVRKVKGDYYD